MASIKFGKKSLTKFMIPITLFEKFSCERPISHIKIKNMTRNSHKTNKLRYVNYTRSGVNTYMRPRSLGPRRNRWAA